MIKLTIDEVEIEIPEGTTVLEASLSAEIYIPHLCSHPDLPAVDPKELVASQEVFQGSAARRSAGGAPFEGCLLCLVEIDGRAEPVRACVTKVEEGMRVTTSTAEVVSRRRAKLKKLFSTHPHACVQCAQRAGCALEPCSTNVAKEERCCPIFHVCELRKVAEFVGIPADTSRYRPTGLPILDGEPLFLRDHNLCVGCLRCVRMCREVRNVDALGFVLDETGTAIVGTKAPTLKDSGCRFCLSCVEVCPTGALRLKFEDPRQDGVRLASCAHACPAGIDIPRYLREIRREEFARAEAVVREAAPFPRVLGQVCFHPCEEKCIRSELRDPIAICGLKRAAIDYAETALWKSRIEPRPATGKKVAIVGAGPAGLTAAWFLRLKGHEVTVFDAQSAPGGWLRDGIPSYRLARAALDADIADISGLGIELKMSTEVGRDVSFEEIRTSADAVFIASGARKEKRLPCDGSDLEGVESGLALLKNAQVKQRSFSGEKIVIIGGGNVAIDVARTVARLGPEEVHLYCLEERAEMPAHCWEIEEAEREGIVLHPGWGPKLLAGEGNVARVDFRKCVSVFDDGGRFAPKFDESVTTSQETDRVFIAIGAEPILDFLGENDHVDRKGAGNIASNPDSMETSMRGVFAGGEVVSGPASVVDAIDHGRRAASGIDRCLGGDGDIYFPLLDETELDGDLGRIEGFFDSERIPMPGLPAEEAVGCFALVETGYGPEEAVHEAGRCLRCDIRLAIHPVTAPPDPWLEFTQESIAGAPAGPGVYQLLDENKAVYAIAGVDNLRGALSELLETSTKAKFFLFDEDPMYSKRESELIQEYLGRHGCMPPGEGEDDLDDLF